MSIPAALIAMSVVPEGSSSIEDLDETIAVAPGGTLSIDLDRGRVSVRSHDADVVHITARVRGFAVLSGGFDLERRGNDVHLRGAFPQSFPFVPWGPRVSVEAWVPRQYSVLIQTRAGAIVVGDITGRTIAETSGGEIQVEGCHGPVSIETSGGRMRVRRVDGDVVAQTSGGRIEMDSVTGNVEAVTSGGAIALHQIGGRIEAHTSGGAIAADFSQAPSGSLETSGGRIEVSFAAEAKVDLDAETTGGHVDVEHAVAGNDSRRRHRVAGAINGGGEALRLRTSGGNIRVRAS